MCRLLAQISLQKDSAARFLVESRFCLLRQSFLNKKNLQKDGWGAAWLNGRGWKVQKSPRAIYKEKEKFRKFAQSARSAIFLAHIRHASNPKKIPFAKLIHINNTQPFLYKNLVFAHNGTLNIPDEVARALGPWRKKICGVNDSEVLFWLFVKIWKESPGRWKRVFPRMVRSIRKVWNAIPAKNRRFKKPFSGLNCIASDGKTLAAFCFYENPDGVSLCGQGRPYFQMCYNVFPNKIAVASEPPDDQRTWVPLKSGEMLAARGLAHKIAALKI